MKILEVEGLNKYFGGLAATVGSRFPRGAGRDSRSDRPQRRRQDDRIQPDLGRPHARFGCDKVQGPGISGLKPHLISRMGIARTFQSVKIFPRMSVLDNVRLGYLFGRTETGRACRRGHGTQTEEILEFVGLVGGEGVPGHGPDTRPTRKGLRWPGLWRPSPTSCFSMR